MKFAMMNSLYFYISFCSMCAVPIVTVFCSSLISTLPGVLLRYILNDLNMVSVAIVLVSVLFLHFTCGVLLV